MIKNLPWINILIIVVFLFCALFIVLQANERFISKREAVSIDQWGHLAESLVKESRQTKVRIIKSKFDGSVSIEIDGQGDGSHFGDELGEHSDGTEITIDAPNLSQVDR